MSLTFTIPGRGISANRNWRGSSGVAKPFLSKESKAEKARIRAYIFQAAVAIKWQPVKWFTTKVIIFNGLQDLDNSAKLLMDSMAGAAIQNDRYHLESHTCKRWDDGGPRIEVTVAEADPSAYGRTARGAAPRAPHAAQRRALGVSDGRRPLLPPMVARALAPARPLPAPRLPRRPPAGAA